MDKRGFCIGGQSFTSREVDILSCLNESHSNKGIGKLLSISHKTVETHNRSIMQKIGCTSREEIRKFIRKNSIFKGLKEHYTNIILANKKM